MSKVFFQPIADIPVAALSSYAGAMDASERVFVRPDGEQRVSVVRREDGFYTLREETRFWEEPHPAIGDGRFYWSPTVSSLSLYESAGAALSDAAAKFAWVRDQLNKD